VVWLDWTEDGRELAALSDDGTMARWAWAATQPTDTIGPGGVAHSNYAPAAPDGGNDCGQTAAAENRHATPERRRLQAVNQNAMEVYAQRLKNA
jgi:hypothetical protein